MQRMAFNMIWIASGDLDFPNSLTVLCKAINMRFAKRTPKPLAMSSLKTPVSLKSFEPNVE